MKQWLKDAACILAFIVVLVWSVLCFYEPEVAQPTATPTPTWAINTATPAPTTISEPRIYIMHNWANDPYNELPSHGSWMWWGWEEAERDDFSVIDTYLLRANARNEPIALSILPYPDLNLDSTPKSVYASIGRSEGWTAYDGYGSGKTITYPAWNDAGGGWRTGEDGRIELNYTIRPNTWDAAWIDLIHRFGAKYDDDPRIKSIWIGTALYGETVLNYSKGGVKYELVHNPVLYFIKTIDAYVEAFPNTPLYIICTGVTSRDEVVAYAIERGVGIKLNALCGDLPNDMHVLQAGSGLTGVLLPISDTVPIAFEHFFADTPEQAYPAMLKGLWLGMGLLDLPIAHLRVLRDTELLWGESLWAFTQRMMEMDGDYALFVARDTRYPCTAASWTCGYAGAWERGITMEGNGIEYLPYGSEQWKAMPEPLRSSIYAAAGVGHINSGDQIKLRPRLDIANDARVELIVVASGDMTVRCGDTVIVIPNTGTWIGHKSTILNYDGEIVITGAGFVHMVACYEAAKPVIDTNEPTAYADGFSDFEDHDIDHQIAKALGLLKNIDYNTSKTASELESAKLRQR